jgi:heat shock protein 5
LIGRNFSDPKLKDDVKRLPYNVIDKDGLPFIEIQTNGTLMLFSPEDITAMVISNLKTMAETYLNRTIQHAVITVPSYFNLMQRQATKDSVTMTGLEVLQQYDESIAAGIAFEVDNPRPGKGSEKCAICHFIVFHTTEEGSELASASIERGVFNQLAIVRDSSLDANLLEQESSSSSSTQQYNIGHIFERFYLKAVQLLPSKPKFHYFENILAQVEKLLKHAGLAKEDINWLILTGDSEQVVTIKPLIETYFNGKKILSKSLCQATIIPVEEAIVRGVALQGERLSFQDGCIGYTMDFAPLSLGIETIGDVFTKLILRNTVIPQSSSRMFSTIRDNQTSIVLRILEGENVLASKNREIASLNLTGLTPRLRLVPEIVVTFLLHPNETLQVLAEDKESGKRAMVFIEERTIDRYTWEKIDEIVKEGDAQFQEDSLSQNQLVYNMRSGEELDFGVVAVELK